MRALGLALLLLLGCNEYGFGTSKDDGSPYGDGPAVDGDGDGIPDGEDPDDDGDGEPDVDDDDDDGDGIPDEDDPDDDDDGVPDRDDPDDDGDGIPDGYDDDDDGDGIPDEDDPDGGGGGPDDPEDVPDDWEPCTDGYYADYFNLPADHPEVETSVSGVTPGDDPFNHDWWDPVYWVWRTVDPNLEFGTGWWPVDTGLEGDPQYYAVYWLAYLDVAANGTYSFEMASDDDAWAYVDGTLVADLGGIHGVAVTTFTVPLTEGAHVLELYFAERHTVDAGFWFKWQSPDIRYYACP